MSADKTTAKTKIKFFDVAGAPEIAPGGRKEILVDSAHFHVWIHGDWPGFKGNMHCHSADEFFYCVRGRCVFHFPDQPSRELKPGSCVVIPKGQSYQIEHLSDGYLALLGARAEPDGMERWTETGVVAESDTEGGRSHKAAKPRRPGTLD